MKINTELFKCNIRLFKAIRISIARNMLYLNYYIFLLMVALLCLCVSPIICEILSLKILLGIRSITSKLDFARVKIQRVVNASCTRCREAFRTSRKSPHPVMMSRDLPWPSRAHAELANKSSGAIVNTASHESSAFVLNYHTS